MAVIGGECNLFAASLRIPNELIRIIREHVLNLIFDRVVKGIIDAHKLTFLVIAISQFCLVAADAAGAECLAFVEVLLSVGITLELPEIRNSLTSMNLISVQPYN